MPLDEQQKKNLMILGVVGAGGVALFLIMKSRSGQSSSPVQAATPVFSSGYPGGSTYYAQNNNDCTVNGCPQGQTCVAGVCVGVTVPPSGGCADDPGGFCARGTPGFSCVNGHCTFQMPIGCGPDHLLCPPGQHCENNTCVADPAPPPSSCQYGRCDGLGPDIIVCGPGMRCVNGCCQPAGPPQSPIAPMHFPTLQPVPGGKGGEAPQGEINNNIYGDHADGRPSGYTDQGDFLYNWNLLGAYYAMRFS